MLTQYWLLEGWVVRLFLLAVFGVSTVTLARLGRLAFRLYLYRGDPISLSKIVAGEIEPGALAEYAVTHRSFPFVAPGQLTKTELEGSHSSVEKVVDSLRIAENRLLYLSGICLVNLKSVRRSIVFAFLLCVLLATFGAMPIYSASCQETLLPQWSCALVAVEKLLDILAFGILTCAGLHFLSSQLERTLGRRLVEWKYFFGTLNDELSRLRGS